LVAALAALAVGGCGGDGAGESDGSGPSGSGSSGSGTSGSGSGSATRTVDRVTTVEVVPPAAADRGGFDPAAVYARDSPGVVTVFSVLQSSSQNLGGEGGEGVGSGFVLNGSGEIATNAHVVTDGTGAAIKRAKEVYVAFADGNEVSARIVGFDPNADVALLRVDPGGLTLRPLRLGTVSDLRVGSPVAAIGSPFGEPQSLSVGVVSATDRSIKSLTGFEIAGAIQTDAAINRGNSGGPLVNGAGEVLGINSQIQTTSGGGEGVGYAIPADTVRRTLARLRRDGRVDYAYLGVATTRVYPQLARRFKLPVSKGAWVQEVVQGGPADKAGLRAGSGAVRFQARSVTPGGDIITAVDGRPLNDEAELGVALLRHEPGDEVVLRVYRAGRQRDVKLELGSRPKQSDPALVP
jgi:S1-C subfamily serine protease